ncbi:MAG: YcII domain protein [Xanthomonadaceae bacterium]|nr:YcII domain protein [Xanthomonadaceae bacterium]
MKCLPMAALAACFCLAGSPQVSAQKAEPAPSYDAALAQRLGADQRGMRTYVLVILKTGPTPVSDGEERKAMFAGHFANIERLAAAGKLVLAGPFDKDPAGWRGLFVLAVADLDEARRLTATDPVIVHGEMVAEYHRWYGSAATMMIPQLHARLLPKAP